MKKIALFSLFGLLFSVASLVSADTSIKYPSTFTLKVSEKAYIANYQNMKIEFISVDSTSAPTNDPRPGSVSPMMYYAMINVSTEGGCGTGADPRCLGGPAYQNNFAVGEGQSINVLAMRIKVTNITNNSATFSVSLPDGGVVEPLPPPALPLPPKTPKPNTSVTPGTVEGSDKIIVCPNGVESENCSVCSGGRCVPVTANRSATPIPGVLRLEKGETLVSADKASTTEVSPNLYEVKTKRKARLLFLIPVSENFTYSVDNKTGSSTLVSRPWWSFLAW